LRRDPPSRSDRAAPAAALALALAVFAALAAFWPVLSNGFVNWDDPSVLLENAHLGRAGIARWAFSTTLMGHYQPLAWIAWSILTSRFGLSAAAFHGVSLAFHLVNGVLVFVLAARLIEMSARDDDDDDGQRGTRGASRFVFHTMFPRSLRAVRWTSSVGALCAAALFLLHPAAVEPVAWASAFPYVLSLFALLLSFLAYVDDRRIVSLAFYAVSLATRATALGYPLVLLIADWYPLGRARRGASRTRLLEKVPFAALAAAAALLEWRARDVASLQEIGVVPRLALAAAAPFVYLARALWPAHLTPLHPLPISPAADLAPLAIAAAGLAAASLAAWRVRARWPGATAAWFAYLTLLAPIAGLTPSGLQATADRYMYVPGVLTAIVAGALVAHVAAPRWRLAAAAAVSIAAALGVLTWSQTKYWKSSTTLWTRAVEIDPRNDVATYNLAIALAGAGRSDEAIGWYERTIALVPDHDLARKNLAILQAADAEREGDRLAAAGRAGEASDRYARALALDPQRSHARAARGMLLVQRGEFEAAAADLRAALDAGVKDLEVPNALAYALAQSGDAAGAARVLARAAADHPEDVNVKHNLARLLATSRDPRVRDGATAVRLALEVSERTGNRDPRALDTLSAAYAAEGRLDLAREAASRAAARARELGDVETAAEIEAHARAFRRP
jgi:protein O-mannosyl-transferase